MNSPHAQAAAAYRAATLENAPPLKIVVMLYEGAIRFLERARRLDPAGQPKEFVEALSRADKIVCELRFSLDHTQGPEIAGELERLYLFCEAEISDALAQRSAEPVQACIAVLEKLLEGWRGVEAGANAA